MKVFQPRTPKHAADSVRLHKLIVEPLIKKKRLMARRVTQGNFLQGKSYAKEIGRGSSKIKSLALRAPTT